MDKSSSGILSYCLFLSLEKIGVVITGSQTSTAVTEEVMEAFNAKAGQTDICSVWHPQKLLEYLSAAVTQE